MRRHQPLGSGLSLMGERALRESNDKDSWNPIQVREPIGGSRWVLASVSCLECLPDSLSLKLWL